MPKIKRADKNILQRPLAKIWAAIFASLGTQQKERPAIISISQEFRRFKKNSTSWEVLEKFKSSSLNPHWLPNHIALVTGHKENRWIANSLSKPQRLQGYGHILLRHMTLRKITSLIKTLILKDKPTIPLPSFLHIQTICHAASFTSSQSPLISVSIPHLQG